MFAKFKVKFDINKFYFQELKLRGVGLRALVVHQQLFLRLGYSHYIVFNIPETIFIKTKKDRLLVFGNSKVDVTTFSSKIRHLRLPDVYKSKGVSYSTELFINKLGKQR
jgi:large subunit ribosomal protein L6